MSLKSYSNIKKKKLKKRKSNIISDGITALLGVALISTTADAVRRI